MEEMHLIGGKTTAEVVKKGEEVCRTPGPNADFVHEVLRFLEQAGVSWVPAYLGVDKRHREILRFLPGEAPADLGGFSQEQEVEAARMIRRLHDVLRDFPGCPPGQTVCHNDLSPCNFVFQAGMPAGVIDWDAAAFGEPLDDLAYAMWMWLDIGNPNQNREELDLRWNAMLQAYGADEEDIASFAIRMARQMDRVAASVFPDARQTRATREWALSCKSWLQREKIKA